MTSMEDADVDHGNPNLQSLPSNIEGVPIDYSDAPIELCPECGCYMRVSFTPNYLELGAILSYRAQFVCDECEDEATGRGWLWPF